MDKEVFLGKRESKTVLREPLGTLKTTMGKQCNKNRGMELANHLLKIVANPTLDDDDDDDDSNDDDGYSDSNDDDLFKQTSRHSHS